MNHPGLVLIMSMFFWVNAVAMQQSSELTTEPGTKFKLKEVLSRFLEQSETEGQSATRQSFRQWLRKQLS